MAVGIGWNAGVVRARLLGRRRLGAEACRDLARSASLVQALPRLTTSPYGHDVDTGMSLERATWAVMATPLWHLRILAGWLPPAGGELTRVLAGWWEVLNVESLLSTLADNEPLPLYQLGRLATAWDHLRHAHTAGQLRAALAASPWLDPGDDDLATICVWLRLSWANRVAEASAEAARPAAGWAALVAAQDLLLGGRMLRRERARRIHGLEGDWARADSLRSFVDRLPATAAWVFEGVSTPADLWRAEVRWWRTLDEEGRNRLRRAESGPAAVVGAFAALLADAHALQGALQLAARGGDEEVARDTL